MPLDCIPLMQKEGQVIPHAVTFDSLLLVCIYMGEKKLHYYGECYEIRACTAGVHGQDALSLRSAMQNEGMISNAVTLVCLQQACVNMGV